jgi:hypothetical protein
MGDQQRTGKIAREPFIAQITHPKLETATRACATSSIVLAFHILPVRRALIIYQARNSRTAQKFFENFV